MNREGYSDPTADLAIGRIMRKERRSGKKHDFISKRPDHGRGQLSGDLQNGQRGRLAAMGYKVINPAEMIEILHEGASYEDFLDIDLALLAKADVLVQLPDWESSRGANRELGFTLGTDKIVVSLDSLLGGGDGRGPAGDL